jgi:hypothetical protein
MTEGEPQKAKAPLRLLIEELQVNGRAQIEPTYRLVTHTVCATSAKVERTGIEPVTSDLQIPDFKPRLGQVRSVKAKLCWLGEVEIGYSGTQFGTRFSFASGPVLRQ